MPRGKYPDFDLTKEKSGAYSFSSEGMQVHDVFFLHEPGTDAGVEAKAAVKAEWHAVADKRQLIVQLEGKNLI